MNRKLTIANTSSSKEDICVINAAASIWVLDPGQTADIVCDVNEPISVKWSTNTNNVPFTDSLGRRIAPEANIRFTAIDN